MDKIVSWEWEMDPVIRILSGALIWSALISERSLNALADIWKKNILKERDKITMKSVIPSM